MLVFAGSLVAQDIHQVFKTNELVYFGLDFYKAKLIGSFDEGMGVGMRDGRKLKANLIPKWNMLIAGNPKKFKIKEAFNKSILKYDIGPVMKRNESIDADMLLGYNDYMMTLEDVKMEVKELSMGDFNTGVGVVFIVNNFNKIEKKASVNIVFFDIPTKEVYFSEVVEGEPGGPSLLHHWANAVNDIINKIDRKKYSRWKSTYNK